MRLNTFSIFPQLHLLCFLLVLRIFKHSTVTIFLDSPKSFATKQTPNLTANCCLSSTKNNGFTLVELVVVIMLLGVITVLAVPKFTGFGQEARISQLKSLAANINSQNQLVYSKSVLDNIEHLEGCSYKCGGHPNWDVMAGEYFVDVSGTRLYVSLGYPLPPLSYSPAVEPNYRIAFGLPESDFVFTQVWHHGSATAIVPAQLRHKLNEIKDGRFQCHIEYTSPTPTTRYKLQVYSQNC